MGCLNFLKGIQSLEWTAPWTDNEWKRPVANLVECVFQVFLSFSSASKTDQLDELNKTGSVY